MEGGGVVTGVRLITGARVLNDFLCKCGQFARRIQFETIHDSLLGANSMSAIRIGFIRFYNCS